MPAATLPVMGLFLVGLLATAVATGASSSRLSAPVASTLRKRGHHAAAAAAAAHEAGNRPQSTAAPPPPAWRDQMDRLHTYPAPSPGPSGTEAAGIGLNVRDFGALGAGVCLEAADRSWTRCSGPDESAALQQAIDAAQHLGRALYLPAGVYMVNRSLVIRKPSENKTIASPQPWVGAGLRIVGEGISRTVIVAQCSGGAGCMNSVVFYEGNQREPDLEGVTSGHSMESLSVSAAGLATHAIHGPAIIWSRWFRVGAFDAVRCWCIIWHVLLGGTGGCPAFCGVHST